MTKLLTTQDLADLMAWSVKTIYQRRWRGDSLPPSNTIGNTVRYRQEDVDAWLASHTTTGTDAESPDSLTAI